MNNNEQSQHLEYFKVENFKGLESLELKEIQQFNLILGDNNIGKTSVLEALLFDEEPYNLLSRINALFNFRSFWVNKIGDELNYLKFFIRSWNNNDTINYKFSYNQSKINELSLSLLDTYGEVQSEIDNLSSNTFIDLNQLPWNIVSIKLNGIENFFTLDFNLHKRKKDVAYFPFMKSGLTYQSDLVEFYSRNINKDTSIKKEFISDLYFLLDDVSDIIIDTSEVPNNPVLLVLFKNDKNPIPLFMMGDGTIRLIRIILEIIVCSGKRLMIDEIDNGMHFSKMKKVWEVVIKVAAKYNTQLFVTTHDAECLRAFKEVLESEELSHLQEKVASYTLFRNKENKVDSVKYNFQEFEHAIEYSLNVRG